MPARNKSKYEYTLQGWKAFALSHSVQTGDRLQIELLPDSRRMRADIVKRAALKERIASDPGPESPALLDMASAAKRQHNSGAAHACAISETQPSLTCLSWACLFRRKALHLEQAMGGVIAFLRSLLVDMQRDLTV